MWFLALICATAQQSYCCRAAVRRLSARPSSVVRKTSFLRNRQAYERQNLGKATCPPDLQTIFFLFQNFILLQKCFSFSLTWDHMGEHIQTTSSLIASNRTDSLPKIHSNSSFLPKLFNELWNVKFWMFAHLFSFSFTRDHIGVRVSNDISSETPDSLPKLMYMYSPREGLCQSCEKTEFLTILFTFNMLLNGRIMQCEIYW